MAVSSKTQNTELSAQLSHVPQQPGVYLWKDALGKVLYVGKAKQLRSRMRQYTSMSDERVMIPALMAQTASFDYIVTQSEHESLILEKNLINQYSPPFNVDFKDDKSYPFIALTTGDAFPAIKYTREKPQQSTTYFGPYTDARAAREMMETARRIVPICHANCVEWKRLKRTMAAEVGNCAKPQKATLTKSCFDHHVGLGPGPCSGAISQTDYKNNVEKIKRFLNGRRREFAAELENDILTASNNLEFERAARIKKRLDTVKSLEDKQTVVLSSRLNLDVIGIAREETIAGVQVFIVRDGIMLISNDFILDKGMDVSSDDLLRGFILRYYEQASLIPREVVVQEMLEDTNIIEEWLTTKLASKQGAKVRLVNPIKGERHDLLALAERNARHALNRYKVRTQYDDIRINRALLELESALALPQAPMRIECFDVSTIHGRYSVASMVVFTAGQPNKHQYRRFKIKGEFNEANDFAMMSEVFARRYAPNRMADERFGSCPDLIIVDGGKPQLAAATAQLSELGLNHIALCGLAKQDEELFVNWSDTPIILPNGSPALYMVKRVRDESHRFAITYHRELRAKAMTTSVLDDIDGLGVKRKKSLLRHFGSLKRLRMASLDELKLVKGIPATVALAVYECLRDNQNESIKDGVCEY